MVAISFIWQAIYMIFAKEESEIEIIAKRTYKFHYSDVTFVYQLVQINNKNSSKLRITSP